MEKMIAEGAEARIFLEDGRIVKRRAAKHYRLRQIDEKLRKFRTRREAKLFQAFEKIGFPSPKMLGFSDKRMEIEMEFLPGKKIRDILSQKNCRKICTEIGEKTGILHKNSIIHGDLTTSNMILHNGRLCFIDFGLSFFSHKIEDKAVDLHLLKQALESRHYRIWENCIKYALNGYKKTNPQHRDVLNRLENVEKRGRHKAKGQII